MCELHPYFDDFVDLELPLFQRYDLSVEFLRRRMRARELVASSCSDQGSNPDEATAKVVDQCVIYPLSFLLDQARLVVKRSGVVEDTREPCFLYLKIIPFLGDPELWQLSPGEGMRDWAEGTIAYHEYVTGAFATNEHSGLQQLSQNVEAAIRAMGLQERRIRVFNDSLDRLVDREMRKRAEIVAGNHPTEAWPQFE